MFSLNFIKNIYHKTPQNLLLPLQYVPFKIFCGKSYRETLLTLQKFQQYSDREQDDFCNKLLVNYLNESINGTRFYRDFSLSNKISVVKHPEQIFDFPILYKEQIQKDLDWFLDKNYKKYSYMVTTGGTTGNQTKLYMYNKAYAVEWAFLSDFLQREGVNIDSRRLCLRGVSEINRGSFFDYNHLYKELRISPFRLNGISVKSNFSILKRFKPVWIHGYPSTVYEFCKHLKANKLTLPSISNVLLVSEQLYPEQESIINEVLKCRISTFYGMSERVIFAPRVNNIYVPSRLYGFTELINDELVGTGFMNKATRLIRYKTGDTATAVIKNKSVKEVYSLEGRWGKNFLIGKNNVRIYMSSLNVHSLQFKDVIRYQFYQKKIGECLILLQGGAEISDKEIGNIIDTFQKKVGTAIVFTPKIVSNIPLTSRGKHQFIISEIEENYEKNNNLD